MDQTTQDQNKSKLVRGIVIGGIIGGALMLLNSSTRTKVKETAIDMKDSSMDMINQVKENPGEVKDDMINRFKSASEVLKEAISDAQSLYATINEDVFSKVSEVKEISTDAVSTAMKAKNELMGLGSKVAVAGSQLKETSTKSGADSNSDTTTRNQSYLK